MLVVIIAIIVLLLLVISGVRIAFAIGIASLITLFGTIGGRTFYFTGLTAWAASLSWTLMAVPLFVFMGEVLNSTGLANRIFKGLSVAIAGLPGGLIQANILSCTIFAACSGSSVASAATMGKVVYPELVKRGYNKSFITGSIAAGGTLAILIPPSVAFIVYGSIGGQSVGRLFIAGLIPGLILAGLFMAYVALVTRIRKDLVPVEAKQGVTLIKRLRGLGDVVPMLLLVVLVLGTIYAGVVTPTEAAAVGSAGSILLAIAYRCIDWKTLMRAALNTVRTTSMVMVIYIAALVLSVSLAYFDVPPMIATWAAGFADRGLLFVMIVLLYLVLGCFFEGLSILVLTLPFILPVLTTVGFDLVWFGVVLVILIEAGALTPPIGMNLFVLSDITGVPLSDTTKGSLPYIGFQVLLIVALYFLPDIALWLPTRMIA